MDFKDEDLRRLYGDPGFRHPRFGPEITRQYRKQVAVLANARNLPDLYAMKGLHFEKLSGQRAGQYSVRLNRQWRLALQLIGEHPQVTVLVLEIVDYH